jgi:hypothetical protein
MNKNASFIRHNDCTTMTPANATIAIAFLIVGRLVQVSSEHWYDRAGIGSTQEEQ